MFANIPKPARDASRFIWGNRPRESPVTPVGAPLVLAWYCVPELGYCGAGEKGIRCHRPDCADRGLYHDPGDEDKQP